MDRKKNFYTICSAVVVTLAMLLNYNIVDVPEYVANYPNVVKALCHFWESIQCDAMVQMVLFVAVAVAIYKSYELVKESKTVLLQVLTFLLAVMMAVGKSMSATNSLLLFYNGPVQVIKTILIIVGYYVFYLHCAVALYSFVKKDKAAKCLVGTKFFSNNFYKKPFWLLFAIWMPQIILKFPGGVCWDTLSELYQYFRLYPFTAHHPPFDTWLMGIFFSFGKHIGSMTAGMFLYIVVQTLCFIAVMAYTFPLLERLKVRPLYRMIILCIYAFVPYFVGYSSVVIKDSIYGIAFLWYFLCLIYLICDQYEFLSNRKNIVRMVASAALVALSRKNGIYVVIPMAIALIIYFVKVGKEDKKKLRLLIVVLIAPIIINYAVGGILTVHYKIQKGSKGEMLSIPFQQTARYVKEYGDEVTPEEKEAIAAVLDYDHLAELYNPIISDPVKATFDNSAKPKVLMRYFDVWFKQFTKHPLVYIEATLNSNYGIVCPNVDNYVYYVDPLEGTDSFPAIKISVPKVLLDTQRGMEYIYYVVHEIPVLGLFSNIGFYVVMLLYIFVFMVKDKKYRYLLLTIPGLLSVAITVASPVFLGHPRYLFPVVYTVPVLFALYTVKTQEK